MRHRLVLISLCAMVIVLGVIPSLALAADGGTFVVREAVSTVEGSIRATHAVSVTPCVAATAEQGNAAATSEAADEPAGTRSPDSAVAVQAAASSPTVSYRAHVQNIGWQDAVSDGAIAGTEGRSLRMEALRLQVSGSQYSGGISYSTHVQDIGWQAAVSDGAIAGTVGQALRVEALRISLTGELAEHYDIYYRVHASDVGWMAWTSDGSTAGTTGMFRRIEAVQVLLVDKGVGVPSGYEDSDTDYACLVAPLVTYSAHVQDVGWQGAVSDGATAGTTGLSRRIEALKLSLSKGGENPEGDIVYNAHVQDVGWQYATNDESGWSTDGASIGTTGLSRRLEAIQIDLKGNVADDFDIYYRVHIQDYGWLGWACDGQIAGSTGMSERIEAVQVVLVLKGNAAPGQTAHHELKGSYDLSTGVIAANYCLSKVGCAYSQDRRWDYNVYDCSSLAYRCYRETAAQTGFDIDFMTMSSGYDTPGDVCYSAANEALWIMSRGKTLSSGELQPGDLIFYGGADNGRYRGIYHVAIYVGGGHQVAAYDEDRGVIYQAFTPSNIGLYGRLY